MSNFKDPMTNVELEVQGDKMSLCWSGLRANIGSLAAPWSLLPSGITILQRIWWNWGYTTLPIGHEDFQ